MSDWADRVTVLVTTSPIPSNPSTAIIEETVASITERMQGARVVVLCDGVRAEQEDRRSAYREFIGELFYLTLRPAWSTVKVRAFSEQVHQSGMIRAALEGVETPLVCFVEHDLPFYGDVPLDAFAAMCEDGTANVVRVNINTELSEYHAHMHGAPEETHGIRCVRTMQWSSHPMIARADYLRRLLDEHDPGNTRRTYLEFVALSPI